MGPWTGILGKYALGAGRLAEKSGRLGDSDPSPSSASFVVCVLLMVVNILVLYWCCYYVSGDGRKNTGRRVTSIGMSI